MKWEICKTIYYNNFLKVPIFMEIIINKYNNNNDEPSRGKRNTAVNRFTRYGLSQAGQPAAKYSTWKSMTRNKHHLELVLRDSFTLVSNALEFSFAGVTDTACFERRVLILSCALLYSEESRKSISIEDDLQKRNFVLVAQLSMTVDYFFGFSLVR